MKKIIYIAAIVFGIVSCSKDNMPSKDEPKDLVFTATIENADTKLSVDNDGKIAWKLNDEITITDDATTPNIATYKVTSIDGTTGKATFEKKSGSTLTTSPYTAKYGNISDQWYDASNIGSNITMEASSETTSFNFKNTCGIVKITVTASNIVKIKVGDYTLNFATAKNMEMATDYFMVAVPCTDSSPFSTTKVTLVKSDGSKFEKTFASNSISVARNHVKVVKLNNESYNTSSNYTGFEPIALSGKFTVDSDGNKVRFASGNLYYDGTNFKFEANQYDYRTWPTKSKNAIINGASVVTPSGHTGHLKTRSDKSTMVSESTSDGSVPSSSEDILFAKSTNSEMPGWRMLTGNTNNEWNYLLEKRNTQTLGGTANARWAPVTVCGVVGLIILPDSYTWPDGVNIPAKMNTYKGSTAATSYDSAAFNKLEAAGIVFLPAAGYRSGTTMYNVGEYVNYMGATVNGINVYHVYLTAWNWDGGTKADTGNYGRAIRLVTDVIE